MKLFLAFMAALLACGCSGSANSGVISLRTRDAQGAADSTYNFVVLDPAGKVVWSGIPAQGAMSQNSLRGGDYRVLVIAPRGAANMEFQVDGDAALDVTLSPGGAVRGEAHAAGVPITANVWMPIPGKGSEGLDRFSHLVRSDADGRFLIERLPPGKWTMIVGSRDAGYKEVQVEIKDGAVSELGIVEVK